MLSIFSCAFWQQVCLLWAFLVAQSEKAMAPHSSTLAWKIAWAEKPGGLQSMGSLRVRHDWVTSLSCIGEGNGNPLQCSCLENPRDGQPCGLLSLGSHRVGHDWSDLAVATVLSGRESTCQCRRRRFYPWIGKTPWRRKWQPTPVLLPGKSHGHRSLVGYSSQGHKRSNTI